ncbi:polysaccharide deacetylase family protein [Thiocapsa sp.]|uniref:polysaccharide deacetylase family protein n=1 Tax=Thiocapsa sp. TaxID=2024551 RepID=UPI0025FE76D6|nr:polysaccharide deacetylase family protein [Thiocapsa sp.]
MSSAEPTTGANAGDIRALVSVHDVMPDTLPQVERILSLLDDGGIAPVTLLVVPGTGWNSEEIEKLRRFQSRGCELAGHGWIHHVERITGWAHRVHSRLISRNVAEHLALDRVGIQHLIARCHAWFVEQGLGAPALYCPPAWAMGPIPRSTLASLPFTRYELFSGILSTQTGRMHPVPLTGYEADTAVRAVAIRAWNRLNRRRAAREGWIRIGIHPHDLDLRLAEDLRRDLRRFRSHAGYSEVGAG